MKWWILDGRQKASVINNNVTNNGETTGWTCVSIIHQVAGRICLVADYHQQTSWVLCCWCSVANLCLTLCNPMNCSMTDFSVLHYSWSLLKLMFIELVMPYNHLIICRPILFLPSILFSIHLLLIIPLPVLLVTDYTNESLIYWVSQKVCSEFSGNILQKNNFFWLTQYISSFFQSSSASFFQWGSICIRRPKYGASASVPSSEYSDLISFRID